MRTNSVKITRRTSSTSKSDPGTFCPVCLTSYSVRMRRGAQKCGNLSQSQRKGCVGRVIPDAQLNRAEWRSPYYPKGVGPAIEVFRCSATR